MCVCGAAVIDNNTSPLSSFIFHSPPPSSFLVGIEYILPFVMSLGWMLSVGMIVRSVVKEKETRMKEVMRMMGLGRGQLWLSWFTTSFLTLLISVIIISLALSVSEYTLPPSPSLPFA